ncbi:MAG: hypothetical protein QOJ98_3475 [Acidobacteriota bacterium]|jgi:hypothetical protein|nr:hypothetical protein [Acidobacteriota bacterium]
MMTRSLAVLFAPFLFAASLHAQCGGERWPVKIATDPDAGAVVAAPITTTISTLHSFPPMRPLPQDRRVPPIETTTYSVTATLTEYKVDLDGDYHLILSDDLGRTVVARIPSPACLNGSRFATQIAGARRAFEARFVPTSEFQRAMVPIEVRGVGFFAFLHGQRGMAPNGIELHPVTYLTFSPLFIPAPPPPRSGRRRAITPRGGVPLCRIPTLTLSASRSSACSGESIVLTWQASDTAARVTIDGVGSFPSSGSTTVAATASSAWSGHATTSCGIGSEAVAVVAIQSAPSASLAGPSSLQRGSSASLSCFLSGTSSWTLSSALRNPIFPSSGSGSGAFSSTYTASSAGFDTVTLAAGGGQCGSVMRTLNISISEPQSFGLRCCDGTHSPTCFNCAKKQGCCSSHGGVCGCN